METREKRLIEKLRKIEALFARTSTPGERAAAASAWERIRESLRQLEQLKTQQRRNDKR